MTTGEQPPQPAAGPTAKAVKTRSRSNTALGLGIFGFLGITALIGLPLAIKAQRDSKTLGMRTGVATAAIIANAAWIVLLGLGLISSALTPTSTTTAEDIAFEQTIQDVGEALDKCPPWVDKARAAAAASDVDELDEIMRDQAADGCNITRPSIIQTAPSTKKVLAKRNITDARKASSWKNHAPSGLSWQWSSERANDPMYEGSDYWVINVKSATGCPYGAEVDAEFTDKSGEVVDWGTSIVPKLPAGVTKQMPLASFDVTGIRILAMRCT